MLYIPTYQQSTPQSTSLTSSTIMRSGTLTKGRFGFLRYDFLTDVA
jgi:hypothetical protein